jgi:hypothetical protein
MAKTKARSQTSSSTPDHGKSGINPIPLCACGMRDAIGKLSMKATTSIQNPSRSEVCTRSYSPAKLRDSWPWQFWNSHLGVPRQKAIRMPLPRGGAKCTIWGKVVASTEFGSCWVLWVRNRPWFVLAPKVLQPYANQLVCWFCAGLREWLNCLSLFLVPSWSSNTPLYPL